MEVARDLRRVFDADDPAAAKRRLKDIVTRYQKTAPQLAAWLEQAAPEAMLFPNEASLLRLASAVLSEISDDWETERAYLTMEAR